MNKRFGLKLLGLALTVMAASVFAGTKINAQAILDVNNQLLNPSMVTNYFYNFPGDTPVAYDNDGYLVVGTGEFERYILVVTIDSPVPDVNLTIQHGSLCDALGPGDFTDIDNPSDAADGSTFVIGTQFDPILVDPVHFDVIGTSYNCSSLDQTVALNDMQQLSDGRYGAFVYAQINPRPFGSHQNSFKLLVDNPGARIGYVSELVRRLRDSPANAPILAFINLDTTRDAGISLANVGQPRYSFSNFSVGMSVPCNSATDGFPVTLEFFDIDDISGAGSEPPGVVGGHFQSTGGYPTAYLHVYSRPKLPAGSPWSSVSYPIFGTQGPPGSGLGSGRGSAFRIDVGNFTKFNQYQFELTGISRPNAVQFTIVDPQANLSTSAYEEPCGNPSVDLRVNASDGPIDVVEGDPINVSWTSTDTQSCTASGSGTPSWGGPKGLNSAGEDHTSDGLAGLGTKVYTITCNGSGIDVSDSVTITVKQRPKRPYFQVENGDVSAGTGFGVCSPVGNAPIAAFNNGAPDYRGAGTGLAAFDLGTVTGFASGLFHGSQPRPKALTFANTGVDEYGGGAGALPCMKDYFGEPHASAAAWTGSFANGTYQSSGPLALAAGGPVTIAPGNRVTLYVDGDVRIQNDIVFGGVWTELTVPSFFLVVRGNIYIDNTVGQLDGVYIAQPNGGAGGIVYTCTQGAGAPTNLQISSQSICGARQLTVNGAIAARQIKFLRTWGDSALCSDAASCAAQRAEIINYSPEVWLTPRPDPDSGSGPRYDSITNLPPIL